MLTSQGFFGPNTTLLIKNQLHADLQTSSSADPLADTAEPPKGNHRLAACDDLGPGTCPPAHPRRCCCWPVPQPQTQTACRVGGHVSQDSMAPSFLPTSWLQPPVLYFMRSLPVSALESHLSPMLSPQFTVLTRQNLGAGGKMACGVALPAQSFSRSPPLRVCPTAL